MGPTKKDLDDVSTSKLTNRLWAVVNLLVPVLRPIYRLGFIKRRFANTTGSRIGVISKHAKRGEHDKAAALAIQALKDYRHPAAGACSPTDGHEHWWFFMHLAARSVEACGDQAQRDDLIELARNGVKPFHGYYVALSFLAFSRWKHADGDSPTAVELAEIAASADETWAEPEFVLGWYCLVLGEGDAMRHFAQAVRKDPRMRSHIAKDPVSRQHPHIIQKLKDLPGNDTVTVRDERS